MKRLEPLIEKPSRCVVPLRLAVRADLVGKELRSREGETRKPHLPPLLKVESLPWELPEAASRC